MEARKSISYIMTSSIVLGTARIPLFSYATGANDVLQSCGAQKADGQQWTLKPLRRGGLNNEKTKGARIP